MKRKEPTFKYNYVMLLDDNELDNFINQKTIESYHFSKNIYLNTSSKSALEFLKNLEISAITGFNIFPEIIFIDLDMPIIDGFQFIETLNKIVSVKLNKIKLVILTSSINPNDKKKIHTISKEILFFNKPLTQEILNQI